MPVSSPMVAETAKLHENTFRAVNIALANELALICDKLGISPWEVIEAAATKPFAFLPHYPGPGLGGDCIPVVPQFLAARVREYGYSPRLIDAAHEINTSMPSFVVGKVADALNEESKPVKGSRLLLLGMAYKANVHDTRESPSLEVMRLLLERGGDVVMCDPWVGEIELDGVHHESVEWSRAEVERADCVVLLTRASALPRRAALGFGPPHRGRPQRRAAGPDRPRDLAAAVTIGPVIVNRTGPLLVLGAGYVGAALAQQALDCRPRSAARGQLVRDRPRPARGLEANGARVETADIRDRGDVERLLALEPSRIVLLAAQASRPVSEREPDYTEATNVTGVRYVAETATAPVVFASSLHVYGSGLSGDIGPDTPYGPQGDLAHLSKIYGELALAMHARSAFPLAIMRLGIVYGPSPVEHDRPESQTVVDKFRRLAASGEPLPVDDGGAAIGVVHVEDAARILLEVHPEGIEAQNVAAETVTVADVARLASGEAPADDPGVRYPSPFQYRHRVADYLQA